MSAERGLTVSKRYEINSTLTLSASLAEDSNERAWYGVLLD